MVPDLPAFVDAPPHVPAGRPPDLVEKLARLAAVATSSGVSTLVLRDPATLTWLFDARVHVPQTLDTSCFDAVVELTPQPRLTIVTNAIEAPRLRDTELADVGAEWRIVNWWDDRTGELPTGDRVGSDRPAAGTVSVVAEVAAQRRVLTAHQQSLLRSVGLDSAAAATAAAYRIAPHSSEYAAAAVLAQELLERAIDPVVLLVAGESRIDAHRHPLPTTTALGRRAMLVCCGRRHGVIASVTRIVSFAPLTDDERDAYSRLLRVEAAFLDATRTGVRIGDVVRAGTDAYAANGYPADEWHRHHQGGFSGFQPREFPAHHGSDARVVEGSAVAWNPSAQGWKVEDTCIVRADGPEPVVNDTEWPHVEVAGRRRPGILIR